MHIPEFCIRLNGPTSTTIHKEIAIRFAGRNGMLIQLNNKYKPAKNECFFNVSWLSTYGEEEERIFCGGRYKMEIQTIIIIETADNYQKLFGAFYKMDMMLSGNAPKGNITKTDIDIVSWFISYMLGQTGNENKFDSFIKNSFYLFAKQKTQIVLDLSYLSDVENDVFIGLIMNEIEKTGDEYRDNKIPSSHTNLFRGWLFKMFGNLKEIIVYSTFMNDIYSFNIFQLLSILEEVELPKSFKTMIIKDGDVYNNIIGSTGWLQSVFSDKVQKMFALKNLKINLKTGQGIGKNEDWMVISV